MHMDATGGDRSIECQSEINAGGFGIVYKMRNKRTNETFARKICHSSRFNEADVKKEVAAMQMLSNSPGGHQFIVRLSQHGPLQSSYFIDMEYCSLNLHDYIHNNEKRDCMDQRLSKYFQPETSEEHRLWMVLNIALEVTNGLAFMHDKQQVHRDLKPANILYSTIDSHWKLGDFGFTEEGWSRRSKMSTQVRGTEVYQAPEFYKENGPCKVTNKVDIWALGCIIFELVFGKRAFQTGHAIMRYDSSDQPLQIPFGPYMDQDVRTQLSSIIDSTFNRIPSRRPRAQGFGPDIALCMKLTAAMALRNGIDISSWGITQSELRFIKDEYPEYPTRNQGFAPKSYNEASLHAPVPFYAVPRPPSRQPSPDGFYQPRQLPSRHATPVLYPSARGSPHQTPVSYPATGKRDSRRPSPIPPASLDPSQCRRCYTIFVSRSELFRHLQETGHSVDEYPESFANPDSFQCQTCYKSFGSQNALVSHCNAKHGMEEDLRDPEVEYAYQYRAPVTNTLALPCQTCYRTFDSPDMLLRHITAEGHDVDEEIGNRYLAPVMEAWAQAAQNQGEGYYNEEATYVPSVSNYPLPYDPQGTSMECRTCGDRFASRKRFNKHLRQTNHLAD